MVSRCFGDVGFQNMFFYQTTFNMLEDKGTEYDIGWKSEGVYASKLIILYTAFVHKIKRFGYKIGIQFQKSVLVVKKVLRNGNCKCLYFLEFG